MKQNDRFIWSLISLSGKIIKKLFLNSNQITDYEIEEIFSRGWIKFYGFDEAVVVDVETTGFDPEYDRIISATALYAPFADLKEKLETPCKVMDILVNPGCQIPKEASRIHGITNKDVKNEDSFDKIAEKLRSFIGNHPIIGHNVSFDKKFLNAEFKRAGVKTLARNKSFCTMKRFQEITGQRKGSRLDDVAKILNITGRKKAKHDANEDVMITFQIASFFYRVDNGIFFSNKDEDLAYKNNTLLDKFLFITLFILIFLIFLLIFF